MSELSTVYNPRPDTTPEAELSSLAAVYKFVLDCQRKKGGPETAPDNPERRSDEIRAKVSIP